MTLFLNIGSYEGQLLGFKGKPEKLVNTFNFTPSPSSIRFLASNSKYLLVAGYDEIIRVYEQNKNIEVCELLGHESNIVSIKIFQNYILSAEENGHIFIWRLKDFALLHKIMNGQSYKINDMALHPSGKLLLIATKKKKIILVDLTTSSKILTKTFQIGQSFFSFKVIRY